MNMGQWQQIMAELRQQNAHLDEIRRAMNRVDSRLKDMQERQVLMQQAAQPQTVNVKFPGPKQAGPTDPQEQMHEMQAKRKQLAK